jgi:hypothetical protein
MRESLYEGSGLGIFLVVDEEAELLKVEIVSEADGPDLSAEDEVVVVADGQGCALVVESPRRAEATIGPADDYIDRNFELMVRVHEFFDGWEFAPDDEDDEEMD